MPAVRHDWEQTCVDQRLSSGEDACRNPDTQTPSPSVAAMANRKSQSDKALHKHACRRLTNVIMTDRIAPGRCVMLSRRLARVLSSHGNSVFRLFPGLAMVTANCLNNQPQRSTKVTDGWTLSDAVFKSGRQTQNSAIRTHQALPDVQ